MGKPIKKQAPPPKKMAHAEKRKAPLPKAAPHAQSKTKQDTPGVRHTIEKASKVIRKQLGTKKVTLNHASAGTKRTLADTSVNNMAAANEVQKQKDTFEKANKLFQARSFSEALKLFQIAVQGPSIEIGHVARLHVKMCEQRLQREAAPLETPEDKYNFAVSLMNQKSNLDEAEKHLRAAVQAKDTADHYHYALALCLGLKGDLVGSSQHLARAIALAPNNRAIARNDPDFKEILQSQPMRELFAAKPAAN